MVSTASQIWRNWEVDGVPSSGLHDPVLQEIRDWGTWIESIVSAFLAGGGLIYTTRASLFADLAHPANSMAWVIADATPANNGIYMKNGASGAGSWTRVADLPYSFVKLTDSGAGTPNAIKLASVIPTSASVLRVASVFEGNTGNVTVSENNDTAKSLLTSSGNQIAPGGLVAGMMIAYVDNGTSFRLLSDIASASIQAAAEAAQAAAEAARDAALTAVPNAFPLTRTALAALNTSTITSAYLFEAGREGQFKWTTGNFSTQVTSDTQQGIYVASAANPSGSLGAWVRVFSDAIQASWFGVQVNVASSQTAAMQKFLDFLGTSTARTGVLLTGAYRLDTGIVIPPGVKLVGNGAKPVIAVASTVFDFSNAAAGIVGVEIGSSAGQVYGNVLEYICVKRTVNEAKGSGGIGIRTRAITGVDWQSVVITGFDTNLYMGTSATANTVTTQVKMNNCSFLECATMTARIEGVYEWFAYSCQFGGSYGADFCLFLGTGANGLVSNATHFVKCFFIGPAVGGGTAIGDLARITAGFWHNFDECVFEQATNCAVACFYAADENITLINVNIKNCWSDAVSYGVRNLGAGRPNIHIHGSRLSGSISAFEYTLSAAQSPITRSIVVSDCLLHVPVTTANCVRLFYCRGARIADNTLYTGGTGATIATDTSTDQIHATGNHSLTTNADANGFSIGGTNSVLANNTKAAA